MPTFLRENAGNYMLQLQQKRQLTMMLASGGFTRRLARYKKYSFHYDFHV